MEESKTFVSLLTNAASALPCSAGMLYKVLSGGAATVLMYSGPTKLLNSIMARGWCARCTRSTGLVWFAGMVCTVSGLCEGGVVKRCAVSTVHVVCIPCAVLAVGVGSIGCVVSTVEWFARILGPGTPRDPAMQNAHQPLEAGGASACTPG